MDTLIDRVEHLERECRRLSRSNRHLTGLVAALVVVGVVLSAAGAKQDEGAKVVEAEKFVLKDEMGKLRGVWQTTEEESSLLTLSDEDQGDRLALSVDRDGRAVLDFFDGEGNGSLSVGVNPTGTGGLSIFDEEGQSLFDLGLSPDGSMQLAFRNPEGQLRLGMGTKPTGAAGLSIHRQGGEPAL